MHLDISTEHFRDALGKILSVVDKKNSRPILTYILMDSYNNQLDIIATDLEVSAKLSIEANVSNPGKFCVNAKNIFDILRELPEKIISLKVDSSENILKISCDNIQYSLLVNDPDEFPNLLFENSENNLILNSNQISEIINKTAHAISTDETRMVLNGLFFQEIDSKLRVVATDGRKLSLIETDTNETKIENLVNGIIIPKKGVYEFKKISDTYEDEEIQLSIDDSFLYVNARNTYFLNIRLIARDYPKYQAVIPNKTSYGLIVDRTTFLNAIRRVKIMSYEKSNGVKINLIENEMTITANHPSFGEASESIPIEYTGKNFEIGFNAKYLLDTIATLNEGEISFEFNNEFSPVLIKSSNLPNFLSIVMPLNLQ